MERSRFDGLWGYASTLCVGKLEYIWFDPKFRMINWLVNTDKPGSWFTARYWYSIVSDFQFRVRLEPNAAGWMSEFYFRDDALVLQSSRWENVCTRVCPDRAPSWISDAIVKENRRMDSAEGLA